LRRLLRSVVDSSSSVQRRTPQQYNCRGHQLNRSGCRAKPTSAERSLQIAAARKQVNQLNLSLSVGNKALKRELSSEA